MTPRECAYDEISFEHIEKKGSHHAGDIGQAPDRQLFPARPEVRIAPARSFGDGMGRLSRKAQRAHKPTSMDPPPESRGENVRCWCRRRLGVRRFDAVFSSGPIRVQSPEEGGVKLPRQGEFVPVSKCFEL